MPDPIGRIDLDLDTPTVGQSGTVEVFDASGNSYDGVPPDEAVVRINEVAGGKQHLQFGTPGRHTLTVTVARRNGDCWERATAEQTVTVVANAARPGSRSLAAPVYPLLSTRRSDSAPFELEFVAEPPAPAVWGRTQARLAPGGPDRSSVVRQPAGATTDRPSTRGLEAEAPATRYEWDFGDGRSLTTTTPHARHDFETRLDPSSEHQTFHVSLTTHPVDGEPTTVRRTLSVVNAYAVCKRLGTIVPRVRAERLARPRPGGAKVALAISNVEPYPLTLRSVRVRPWQRDGRTNFSTSPEALPDPLVVAPETTTTVALTVTGGRVPRDALGFAVYLLGDADAGAGAGRTLPVRVEAVFDIGSDAPASVDRGDTTRSLSSDGPLEHLDEARQREDHPLPASFQLTNLVFAAPACTFTLFNQVLQRHALRPLFRTFRMFTLSDEVESGYWQVPFVYPRSLLYLIAGLFERAGEGEPYDEPIFGMERYHSIPEGVFDYQAADPAVEKAALFTVAEPGRVVWAPTSANNPLGLRSNSPRHERFFWIDADQDTLPSIQHMIVNPPGRWEDRAGEPSGVHYPTAPDASEVRGAGRGARALTAATDLVVDLEVPYLHQLWDTPDDFNGLWACGPTCCAMVLAHYGVLEPKPIEVGSPEPHKSRFGWYVSNPFHLYGVKLDTVAGAPGGTSAAGLYGAVLDRDADGSWLAFVESPRGRGIFPLMQRALAGLGAEVEVRFGPKEAPGSIFMASGDAEVLMQATLDEGCPLIASGYLSFHGRGYHHLIVVRGYERDSPSGDLRWIVNDPFGFETDRSYDGNGVVYSKAEIRPKYLYAFRKGDA